MDKGPVELKGRVYEVWYGEHITGKAPATERTGN
jgi:hypothetical protein